MTQFGLKPGTWISVLLLKQNRKTVSFLGFNIVLTHKSAEIYKLVVKHSCKLLKSDKPRNQNDSKVTKSSILNNCSLLSSYLVEM